MFSECNWILFVVRNCDFSVSSEKTMLLVIGGLFIKIYILLTNYDTIVEVLSLETYTYMFRVILCVLSVL